MRPRPSTKLGLFLLVCSFAASLVRFALPFVWGATVPAAGTSVVLGQSVRTFWVPASGDVVDGAIAALGLVGFALLWRGRWEFGSPYAAKLRLGLFAMIAAVIVLAIWFATGLLLGYVSGVSYLIPWRRVLALLATVFLGFALFWSLGYLPYAGMKPVAGITLALGVAGGALAYVATLGLHRTLAATVRGAGDALSVVSLLLWLGLSLWGWDALRFGRLGSPAAAPARTP